MPCAKCNGLVHVTDSTGGTATGQFEEKHECLECTATGRVYGDASLPPTAWTKTGPVFEGEA